MSDYRDIFLIDSREAFDTKALEFFRLQYKNNRIYRQFCNLIGRKAEEVSTIDDIPFLPVEFFKSSEILSSDAPPEIVFSSSGTGGTQTSKHFVTDLSCYRESFRKGFEYFYGDIEDFVVLALLPSYLERKGSSLVYMVQDMIERSKNRHSGFYLNDLPALVKKLELVGKRRKKVLLIGVSFALLELAEKYALPLQNTIVMETGGMKGRRKEIIRAELHQKLYKGFGLRNIDSEYGMTELLSQAYSRGGGVFNCPPWMKIIIRDPEDPLSLLSEGKTGGINIIDLANINSCSFIATQDLGKILPGGGFEVLGRFDNSDIRGCNLMVL
ncbi:MAG TPA: acyl transferase [Salinimicrobium sp.]|nr:acyl transferase [Salinimicrobium sp.]